MNQEQQQAVLQDGLRQITGVGGCVARREPAIDIAASGDERG